MHHLTLAKARWAVVRGRAFPAVLPQFHNFPCDLRFGPSSELFQQFENDFVFTVSFHVCETPWAFDCG